MYPGSLVDVSKSSHKSNKRSSSIAQIGSDASTFFDSVRLIELTSSESVACGAHFRPQIGGSRAYFFGGHSL